MDFGSRHREDGAAKPGTLSGRRKFHASCLHQAGYSERSCRWIHIPINDVGVAKVLYMTYLLSLLTHHLLTQVQECVKTLFGEATSQHLLNTWMQKLRPAISDSPVTVPNHAWSMEPSIQSHHVSGQLQYELKQFSENAHGYTLFVRVFLKFRRLQAYIFLNPRLFADDFNVSFLTLTGSTFMRSKTKEKTDRWSLKCSTNAGH